MYLEGDVVRRGEEHVPEERWVGLGFVSFACEIVCGDSPPPPIVDINHIHTTHDHAL